MEGGAGAVDGVDSFVVCGKFAPGNLVVVCPEEDVDMFRDACATEVEPSEAEDVIDHVVETVKLESA